MRNAYLLRTFVRDEDICISDIEVPIGFEIPKVGDNIPLDHDGWNDEGFYTGTVVHRYFNYVPDSEDENFPIGYVELYIEPYQL